MYKLGQRVRVISDNDNYDSFRDQVLIVQHISTSEEDTCAYDSSMGGMQLIDFTTMEGIEVPYSLYEYEVESI